MWRETIAEWGWRIVRQRAHCEMNWVLKRRQRWWYTFKALVCLALNRDEYRGFGQSSEALLWEDPVEVAAGGFHRYSHHEFGEAADWDVFQVGHGVRRGWWFEVKSVGYP